MGTENMVMDPEWVKEELLKSYPPKVARKRSKQIIVNKKGEDGSVEEIKANTRTTPGIITQRGCTYAGCRGVVLGPTRDILQIVHGPIGCGFYSWLTRRNQTDAGEDGTNYMPYALSTDMQEEEIIFGGEKKLKAAIQEAYDIFKPKAMGLFATCPVGLIGDDIHAVAREMEEKLGINIVAFSCEGYKGVSQSAGHHIANNEIFKDIVGLDDNGKAGKYTFNLLGEYNIGGDAFELDRMFEEVGMTQVATFSGNSTYEQFATSHTADLNVVMCHRSINYMAEMMETKYGIPWFKINFIGADASAKSLLKMARFYEDDELIAKTEEFIKAELEEVLKVRDDVRSRCEGKLAMLFVGGSRAHHYQELFKEIGMTVVSAGYEFAHRDDYEGRKVLPTIKVDADSRNIEELTVEADPNKYKKRTSEEKLEELKADGLEIRDYVGMMPEMESNTLIIDDITHFETEKLIEIYKPAIFCAGIKEKYAIQKLGVPLKQLHSYDYGGPYAGFKGAINFYKEIDRMVNSKVWSYLKAPWEEATSLTATYAFEEKMEKGA
jgi:nitrogenase molybdenum-iron protein alpha chain